MKLAYKLTSVFLVFAFAITLLFFLISLQNQKNASRQMAADHISNVAVAFHSLQKRDTQMLTASLEAIASDPKLREMYLRKDRTRLYEYALPLFRTLKNRHGITHFYFILPDGTVFLRMHERDLYGDRVARRSFRQALVTGQPSWDMEFGKTAFALRSVLPYYSGGVLVGYLELGEEITHFLGILKEQTGSEFGLFAESENLNETDLAKVRPVSEKNERGNHVIVSSTRSDRTTARCFSEKNLERNESGEMVLDRFSDGKGTFLCSGFSLSDGDGKHIGAILSLLDISDHAALARKANTMTILSALLLFVVTGTVGILLSRTLSRPIERLTLIAGEVGRGNLSQTIVPGSRDEIGQLAQSFRQMVEQRRQAEEALRASEAKYRSLVESTDDSIYVVDSSCRYIYMNAIHRQRLGISGNEYVGADYAVYHKPEHTVLFAGLVERVLNQGVSVLNEAMRGDLWFLMTLSPIKDDNGQVTAITVVSKDITGQKLAEKKLREERDKLQQALADVKQLSGLLPICANCKKIRNDEGYWTQIEQYIRRHTDAEFTHGICPDCVKRFYGEINGMDLL